MLSAKRDFTMYIQYSLFEHELLSFNLVEDILKKTI